MTALNDNHFLSLVIGIIVSAIVWAVICSGCAAKPEPKSWIEIEMSKPEYGKKLSQGVRMLFENPKAFEQIELVIMVRQWQLEDKSKGVANNASRGENR